MSNIFGNLFTPKVQNNTFDLSYDLKLTLDMGDLIPVHCQEIVPGDKITMSTESMLRFAPLIAPIMHKVDVTQHFFFVPNRLVWSGWEKFITGSVDDPGDLPAPYLEGLQVAHSDLADYLGLPVTYNLGIGIDKCSAIPFAAYQMIYNEYYRDENLSPEVNYKLQDGVQGLNTAALTAKRKRAWRHDYFTSALPFAQKGEAVGIPTDLDNATVKWNQFSGSSPKFQPNVSQGGTPLVNGDVRTTIGPTSYLLDAAGNRMDYDPNGTLYVDNENTYNGANINDLRRAFKLQEWLEKNARGGTRYIESILAHFGVRSSDARLNRPQYLGGSRQPMIISEVLQTSQSTADSPQANMAGHGISVGGGKQFTFTAEEHGYIIGVMSILPQTAYQQGIPKHFSKFDKFDYYWPSFAHLGEQAILNREVYYGPLDGDNVNNGTFGYIPRYSEYRYEPSRVAGEFRDDLSYWHMGRIFQTRPALNQSFIEANPTTRVFAVEDIEAVDTVYAHVFHRIRATRKMPKYAIPEF